MSEVLANISTAVIEGTMADIKDMTQQALDEGLSAKEVLDGGLMKGMDYVGQQFKKGDMFVPEVLLSARVMQGAMDILKPKLVEAGAKMAGTVVVGTVQGDLHDIGKNLVVMMLEGAGFEIIDLGNNVSPQTFVDAVKENKPEIVGMSALLTTTMRAMGHTINALKEAGVRGEVKIMIGGAPVTSEFAEQIGADAYCSNAPAGVDTAKKWVSTA
jgi:5-methyltetrahydrofolate--homocysteine methyltransferase